MIQAVVVVLTALLAASPSWQTDESFGYLPIREDASIFYWLMRSGNETHDYTQFPLVIYLAGGPGDGSSGFSNFEEIGPYDLHGNERNNSWIRHANLLFIDFPVGSGYSFVRDGGRFASSRSMMNTDFMAALKLLLKLHPELQSMPSFMFGESYGGRYCVTVAKEIHQQVMAGDLKFNLKAIGLGDSWIMPLDIMRVSPDYLYAFSFIDEEERDEYHRLIDDMEAALVAADYETAFIRMKQVDSGIQNSTFGISTHNVLASPYDSSELLRVMNSEQMKTRLGIPENVTWRGQIESVRQALKVDFVQPVTSELEYLLNETDIRVVVYNGQLDLTCSIMGSERWISNLHWKDSAGFRRAKKQLFAKQADGQPLAYRKEYGSLSLYYILKAGHFVPIDQANAAIQMLVDVVGL